MYCIECAAPLKAGAAYCLECGSAISYEPAAPPTVNAVNLPPLPLYNAAQPLAAPAGATANPAGPAMYEPSLLAQWMSQWRASSPSGAPANPADRMLEFAVKATYFMLVGLWASQIWIVFAWLISLTIVGLPIGMAMVRMLPLVTFMSPRRIHLPESMFNAQKERPQTPFGLRAIYFVLIGWWVSLVWMELAWVFGVTVIGMPLALAMFALTPTVATLARP